MSSSANVIINLMDANNKDPTFLQSTYFLSVKDGKYRPVRLLFKILMFFGFVKPLQGFHKFSRQKHL